MKELKVFDIEDLRAGGDRTEWRKHVWRERLNDVKELHVHVKAQCAALRRKHRKTHAEIKEGCKTCERLAGMMSEEGILRVKMKRLSKFAETGAMYEGHVGRREKDESE